MRTTRFALALLVLGITAVEATAQTLAAAPDRQSQHLRIERELTEQLKALAENGGDVSVDSLQDLINGIGRGGGRPGFNCPPPGAPPGWFIETEAIYSDATIDIEGNLIIGGTVLPVPARGVVTKFKVSNEPASGSDWEWQVDLIDAGHPIEFVKAVEADLEGFVYVLGVTPDDFPRLVKMTKEGGVIWSWKGPVSVTGAMELRIGPEGIPVIAGSNARAEIIAQINPFVGVAEWVYLPPPDRALRGIEVDSRGDVCTLWIDFTNDGGFGEVKKIAGGSGVEIWGLDVPQSPGALRLDSEDNLIQLDSSFYIDIFKYSPSGAVVAEYSSAAEKLRGNVQGIAVDRAGNVLAVARDEDDASTRVYSFNTAGNVIGLNWTTVFGGGEFAGRRITVDRRGNPYVTVPNSAILTDEYSVFRLDPASNGDVVWECVQQTPFSLFAPGVTELLVDGGGSVYTLHTTSGGLGPRPGIVKIEQTVVLPQVFSACPRLVLEDRSLWAPGVGIVDAEVSFFDLPSEIETFNFGYGYFFDIPVPFFDDIEFGARADVDIFTDFGAGFRTEINGGTVDVDFPLDVTWTVPGKPVPSGMTATVSVDWKVSPAARMTSCATPSFNAGLTSFIEVEVDVGARAVAFDSELFNEQLFYAEYVEENDYIFSLEEAWDDIGLPDPGEWQEFELGGFDLKVRLPKLSSQDCGVMDPGGDSYSFASEAEDCFFSGSFSLTNALIEKIVEKRCQSMGIPPDSPACELMKEIYSLDQELEISGGGGELELGLSALQLSIFCDLLAFQNLSFSVTPTVRYVVHESGVSGGGGVQNIPAQPLGDDLVFTMPPSGVVEITPFVSAASNFTNVSGAKILPGVEFNTLEVSGSAEAGGYSLFDFDECLLCFRERFDIFPEIPLFDDMWPISFPELELESIVIKGKSADMLTPILSSASRQSLPMIIYDQTSPSVTGFNIAANGTTKMLLYGDRFGVGEQGGDEIRIWHHGTSTRLDATLLNRNTYLVEIPNWVRLVPGVARISIVNFGPGFVPTRRSEAIDLPIEYPRPRLDTVNPNLWAADPAFATVPIQVIDRKTLLGTDTFITRRDYFINMRDNLWNASTNEGFFTSGMQSERAEFSFDNFDFNQLPAFPAVLFDGLPLERYVQPIDSGIHNVRLAEQNYNMPALVNVQICNPGPGGGISETKVLDIAAPKPVLSSIAPSEIEPGGELSPAQAAMDLSEPPDGIPEIPALPAETEFRIIVRGPVNVPTFDGYEEPKFGNFNAASVVRFDGVDLPTTFISSSELQAFVPDFLVQDEGVARVTVFTPDNDSFYFEELWADANMDGIRDDDPVFQDIVPSGGESAPVFFPIRYRQPVIDQLNPPSTEAGNLSFDGIGKNAPQYNLVVIGKNFRDGAVVLVDGQPRATQFVTRELLRVTLLPGDVSYVTVRRITVQNALPDETLSEPIGFNITLSAAPGGLPRVRP